MSYEVIQQVTVDVSRRLPAPVVFCKQADNVVRVLLVSIEDNKDEYIIQEGFTARLRGTKADGTRIYLDARSQYANKAEFVLTQQALAAYGKAVCEVELSQAGNVVKTCNLVLNVEQAAVDDEGLKSTDEFQSLSAAAAAAEAAADAARQSAQKAEDEADRSAEERTAADAAADRAEQALTAAQKAQSGAQTAQNAAANSAKEAADSATAAEAARNAAEEIAAGSIPELTETEIAAALDAI